MATLTNKNGTSQADEVSYTDTVSNKTFSAGAGNDVITITGGTNNTYNLDAGYNTIYVKKGTGTIINAGSGKDTITVYNGTVKTVNGGTLAANFKITNGSVDTVKLGTGGDKVVVGGGTVNNLALGDGYNYVYVNSGTVGTITGGNTNDTLTVSAGVVSKVIGTNTRQKLTVKATGKVTEASLGGGSDVISLENDAEVGTVRVDSGDNYIYLYNNAKVTNTIYGGSGTDRLRIDDGSINKIVGGTGTQRLTLDGGTVGSIDAGAGDDLISITKATVDSISLNSGSNQVYAYGGSAGTITTGADTDKIKVVGGTIDKVYGKGSSLNLRVQNTGEVKEIAITKGDATITVANDMATKLDVAKGAGAVMAQLGSGDDVILVKGGTDNTIAVGDGEDTATVSAGSVKLITSSDGSLNLSVENEGEVKKIEIGKGYANITINNSTATELNTTKEADMVCAVLGGGHDKAYIYSDEAQIVLGAGRDHIEVYGKKAQIYGDHPDLSGNAKDPTGTSYDDTIILHKEANYCFVDAGNGANNIGVNSTGNKIFAGSGKDTIEVSEEQGVKLDELKSVSVNNEIHAGDGEDNICVIVGAEYTYWENVYYGAYTSVSGGAGNDIITYTKGRMALYNEAKSYAYGGSGDDSFYLDGSGIIANGGNGRDTFYNYAHINKGGNYMIGGAGSDKYYFDLSNGMSIENVYYIYNKSYHTSSDSDILGIIGFTGSLDEIYLLGNKKNTSVRQLRIINTSVTNSSNCHPTLNISISGFDMLSAINLYDNDGQLVQTLGSGTAFEEEWKSRGQFRDVSILECTQASFLNDGYYNSDYSDNIQYFVNDDADLKITGNSF